MHSIVYIVFLLLATFPVLGRNFYQRRNLNGVLLSFCIGIPAWWLGKQVPIIGGAVFGILFGILLSHWKRPNSFDAGIKITSKKILQAAIVLFGFEMNLKNVLAVGSQSLVLMVFTLSACFVTAYFVSKLLKIDTVAATLVGVGTAICGGSAIAATAPVIEADDEQVATSISTIFLFNVMAVFIFPLLGRAMGLSDVGFGMWAGTAINDTSSVVAAAYSFSDQAGNLATIVKLTRTLMIVPITFVLALKTAKRRQATNSSFHMMRIFPWFVLGFLATCLINTTGFLPTQMTSFLGKSGKLFIVVAMSAIGLNTNLKSLVTNGKKSILLGAICWASVAATSLVVQRFLGLL